MDRRVSKSSTYAHYSSVVHLTVAKRKEPSESCPLELTRCFSDNPRYSPNAPPSGVRGPLHRCLASVSIRLWGLRTEHSDASGRHRYIGTTPPEHKRQSELPGSAVCRRTEPVFLRIGLCLASLDRDSVVRSAPDSVRFQERHDYAS